MSLRIPQTAWRLIAAAMIGLVLLAVTYVLAQSLPGIPTSKPELLLGSLIVIAVALMMTLLFVMASGFAALGLSDPKEALGLPSGSVRALIALLLILMFVFFTIFLFSQVAATHVEQLEGLSKDQVAGLGGNLFLSIPNADGTFRALIRVPEDARNGFAQQVFAAALTLVTAVSSFYFGSRSAEGALTAATSAAAPILSITGMNPPRGTRGTTMGVTVMGTGFVSSTKLKLAHKNAPDVRAVDVDVDGPSRILCSFKLPAGPIDAWDLVASNPDSQVIKEAAFELK